MTTGETYTPTTTPYLYCANYLCRARTYELTISVDVGGRWDAGVCRACFHRWLKAQPDRAAGASR